MGRKIKFINIFKHFVLITRHRILVFRLCCRLGLVWRGLVHDLSKYSPIEFWESVRYYEGNRSPIVSAKQEKGYSESWLHHKGRNKHHSEYWCDLSAPNKTPFMPYKYVAEMLCDKLAAGLIYQGKDWNKEYPLEYWNKENGLIIMNESLRDMLTDFFTQVSINGVDKTLNKKNVKELYKKYCTNG